MLLLDYGRSLGMPLRGVHFGAHVGWTTNGEIATKMREHGARVSAYAHRYGLGVAREGHFVATRPSSRRSVSPCPPVKHRER